MLSVINMFHLHQPLSLKFNDGVSHFPFYLILTWILVSNLMTESAFKWILRAAFPPQGITPSDGLTTMPGRGQTSGTCRDNTKSGYKWTILAHACICVCMRRHLVVSVVWSGVVYKCNFNEIHIQRDWLHGHLCLFQLDNCGCNLIHRESVRAKSV